MAFSLNLNFSFCGVGFDMAVGIAVSEQDFTLQFTYADSSENEQTKIEQLGVSAGVSLGLQYTDFESVEKLDEYVIVTGVNTPIGSLDVLTNDEDGYVGWQVAAGPGVSADVHRIKTYTYNYGVWEMWNPVRKIAERLGIRE